MMSPHHGIRELISYELMTELFLMEQLCAKCCEHQENLHNELAMHIDQQLKKRPGKCIQLDANLQKRAAFLIVPNQDQSYSH